MNKIRLKKEYLGLFVAILLATIQTSMLETAQRAPANTPDREESTELQSHNDTTTGANSVQVGQETVVAQMPENTLAESDLQQMLKEFKQKKEQMYLCVCATSALASLTLYYACSTDPYEWLPGTMGSYCTNTLLTAMAANILRQDKKLLGEKISRLRQ